jgi:hypothetical protein
MSADSVAAICRAKPGATEGFPFGEGVLVFKVGGKVFAIIHDGSISLKCEPGYAEMLRQMLAPAGAEGAIGNIVADRDESQEPQEFVRGAKRSARSGASGTSQDGQLMPQQQVLEHEVAVRTYRGQDGREQQPEEFEYTLSIADLWRAGYCRPTGRPRVLRVRRRRRFGLTGADAVCQCATPLGTVDRQCVAQTRVD